MAVATRSELVQRVRQVLAELELLSEAKGSGRFDKDRISQSKSDGQAPQSQGTSSYDQFVGSLEGWCVKAEARVVQARKGRQRAMSPEQYKFWLFEKYLGVSYLEAAQKEGMLPQTLYMMRSRAGRDPKTGELRENAA